MRARDIADRLELVIHWYAGMVSPETGLLVASYDPIRDELTTTGSRIRDIGAIWDMAIVTRATKRLDLVPVIDRSLEHFDRMLVTRGDAKFFDSRRLGEPANIAHSAFLALAHLEDGSQRPIVLALVRGIIGQQRDDGSFAIHFDGEPDVGLELYPGEALLAILRAHAATAEPRLVAAAERGFRWCRARFPADRVAQDLLVFYANWQAQYGSLLHEATRWHEVRDYVLALWDRVVDAGFFDRLERYPERVATVEAACALEGMNDAYAIAMRERDDRRCAVYAEKIRLCVTHLLAIQRVSHCTPRERGGWGHSLTDRTQRIDVTGHVAAGLVKTLENGLS